MVVGAASKVHFLRGAHDGSPGPEIGFKENTEMMANDKPWEGRFTRVPCPVCGDLYAKSGLPNHIRRHVRLAASSSSVGDTNRKSPAWWEGWKEGYKVGIHDGQVDRRRKTSPSSKKAGR